MELVLHINICRDDNGFRFCGIQLFFQVVRGGNENGFAQQTANGSRFFLAICQCICGVPLQSAAIQLPLLGTVTGVCGQPDVISLIIGQCRTGGNAGDLVVQIVSLEVFLYAFDVPVLAAASSLCRQCACCAVGSQILAVSQTDNLVHAGRNIVNTPVL